MKKLSSVLVLALSLVVGWGDQALARPEGWYTYWGLGTGWPTYSGTTGEVVDSFGGERIVINMELLGFYWPVPSLSDRTILGFVLLNMTADTYTKGDAELFVGNALFFGPSFMHFFGTEPGSGLFLRTDLGMATTSINYYPDKESCQNCYTEVSGTNKDGFGVLLGTGYGLPVSAGTRLLFNVNYTLQRYGADTYTAWGVGLGLLM